MDCSIEKSIHQQQGYFNRTIICHLEKQTIFFFQLRKKLSKWMIFTFTLKVQCKYLRIFTIRAYHNPSLRASQEIHLRLKFRQKGGDYLLHTNPSTVYTQPDDITPLSYEKGMSWIRPLHHWSTYSGVSPTTPAHTREGPKFQSSTWITS